MLSLQGMLEHLNKNRNKLALLHELKNNIFIELNWNILNNKPNKQLVLLKNKNIDVNANLSIKRGESTELFHGKMLTLFADEQNIGYIFEMPSVKLEIKPEYMISKPHRPVNDDSKVYSQLINTATVSVYRVGQMQLATTTNENLLPFMFK